MMKLTLSVLRDELSVCRLPAGSAVPYWVWAGSFCSVTKTEDELSVVICSSLAPDNIIRESGFKALKVEGPLDFSLTGILAETSSVLAGDGISIFAVSTYDTDYILVRDKDLDRVVRALERAGH